MSDVQGFHILSLFQGGQLLLKYLQVDENTHKL